MAGRVSLKWHVISNFATILADTWLGQIGGRRRLIRLSFQLGQRAWEIEFVCWSGRIGVFVVDHGVGIRLYSSLLLTPWFGP